MNPAPRITQDGSPIRWSRFPLTIRVWPDVPLEMASAAMMAAHKWNAAAHRHAPDFGPLFAPWCGVEHMDVTVFYDPRQSYTQHSVNGIGRTIDVSTVNLQPLPFWEMVQAAKHELGHALGLAHDEHTPRALMYPKLGTRRQPTRREVLTVVGRLG